MTYSFLRRIGLSLLLAAVFGYIGCSLGTNTGNGTAAGTGGASGSCFYEPCIDPVNVTGSDGTTYRGRIYPDVTIASYGYAQSFPNPPVAELSFGGSEVDLSGAGCQVVGSGMGRFDQVQIFISTADSSIDASGTLHVHSAPRDDIYAAGPGDIYNPPVPGWAVDLAVTVDGQLTATLSVASSSSIDAGESSSSLDAGVAMQELKISGRIEPGCGASMPVSGGRTFSFPCWQHAGCGD
jgi:hypothetical protein